MRKLQITISDERKSSTWEATHVNGEGLNYLHNWGILLRNRADSLIFRVGSAVNSHRVKPAFEVAGAVSGKVWSESYDDGRHSQHIFNDVFQRLQQVRGRLTSDKNNRDSWETCRRCKSTNNRLHRALANELEPPTAEIPRRGVFARTRRRRMTRYCTTLKNILADHWNPIYYQYIGNLKNSIKIKRKNITTFSPRHEPNLLRTLQLWTLLYRSKRVVS